MKKSKRSLPPRSSRIPTGRDTPADEIPLPALHRDSLLPLHALGSVKFEEICRDALPYAYPAAKNRALKRGRGKEQFGVDVEGFNDTLEPFVVVSCKCWRDLRPRYVTAWTDDFIKHVDGHWKQKGVKVFILAVTHACNDDAINAAAKECYERLEPYGIRFKLWNTLLITDLLREEPGLIDRYFHSAWVEAISPKQSTPPDAVAASRATSVSRSAAIIELSTELAEVTRQRNQAISARIESANAAYRAGRPSTLVNCLDQLESDTALWQTLDPAIKGRALRARAMLALNADGVDAARNLLDQADGVAAAPDRSTRAWLLRISEGVSAGLAFLKQPRTDREVEVYIAFLLDDRRATEALEHIAQISTPLTAEQLRLQALAKCLIGKREEAVQIAALSTIGPQPSIAAWQSLAIIRVMAALSDGAEVQLGAVPNPFPAALVKPSNEANRHLDEALAILNAQITSVEGRAASDFEVWKLATLLLHPNRTVEAHSYASEMLKRSDVDPIAVAWCHSHGLRIQGGKIRKTFLHKIRNGTGTPSHLIVLAILTANRRGSSHGADLIAQWRDKFPEARGLLDNWYDRLAGKSTDDAFTNAFQAAERKNYALLPSILKEGNASANQILMGASLLAEHRQWATLNDLRDVLVPMGTRRAVELAARAALEAGLSKDAVDIIDQSAALFPDRQLPSGLQYLRARGHDDSGRKAKAIADLTAAYEHSKDPLLAKQLIASHLGIGDLNEAHRWAKDYIKQPHLDPVELVQLARTFRRIDVDFSKSLVARVVADPKLPPSVTPSVLMLASQLGLANVEDRMMKTIVELAESGKARGIVRFETIEAMLAHVSAEAEKFQNAYPAWLAGERPAPVTFVDQPQTLLTLYVADPRDRVLSNGQPLPMLLRAANAPSDRIEFTNQTSKPTLTLDMSALLLANRLNLLSVIEQAFTVQVPPTLALALLEMEDDWPASSPAFVTAARRLLSTSDQTFVVVDRLPERASPLAVEGQTQTLDDAVLAQLCEQAISAGTLTRNDADRIAGRQTPSGMHIDAVAFSSSTLAQLAMSGLVGALAAAVPTYITRAELEAFAELVDRAERSVDARVSLGRLREAVAKRLAEGQWTTLPRRSEPAGPARAAYSNPLLQAFIDTVSDLQSTTSEFVWIEDRTLSRSRVAKLVNVVDVLHALFTDKRLTDTEFWAADAFLRDIGYAFLPPHIARIAEDVRKAKIVDGLLSETKDLATWRRWYAAETMRLAHANQAPEPDDSGRITGEPRHLVDMMSTARDVLAHIWSDKTSNHDRNRIRSEWVWTCLRFESSPVLARSQMNPEASLRLAATVLAHTADLPLLAFLEKDLLPQSAGKPFLDWFIHSVLEPRCAVDSHLADAFAKQIADLIAPRVEVVAPDDASANEARTFMVAVARRYLSLFPTEWRDRIMAHGDLIQKLDLPWMFTMHIGDSDILADRIETAIASVIQDVTSTNPVTVSVPVEGDGTATLTLSQSVDGRYGVLIKTGTATAILDPTAVALSLPDKASRESALRREGPLFDRPPQALTALVDELVTPADIAVRVTRFNREREMDFAARLHHIEEQLVNRRALSPSDVALASPATLAAYLRLPNPERADSGSWRKDLLDALRLEFDASAIATRCGAIPFDLANDAFGGCAPWQTSSSCCDLLARLKSMFEAGSHIAEVRNAYLERFIDLLERQVPIMAALLSTGGRTVLRSPDWQAIQPDIALSLLWVWADQISASMVKANADPEAVVKFIRRIQPADLSMVLHEPSPSPWFYTYATNIDEPTLAGALIARYLALTTVRDLYQELVTRLLTTIGFLNENLWYPKFEFATAPAEAPADLWIAGDPIRAVQSTGVQDVHVAFLVREPDLFVKELLKETTQDDRPFAIISILDFVPIDRLSPETLRAIVAYVDAIFIRLPQAENLPGAIRATAFKVQARTRIGEETAIVEDLRWRARACAARHRHQRPDYTLDSGRSAANKDLVQLLEFALTHARHMPGRQTEKIEALVRMVDTVSLDWPTAVQGLVEFLDRCVAMLPATSAPLVWPTLLRVRSRS